MIGSEIHVARTHRRSGLTHIAAVRTLRSIGQNGLLAAIRCAVHEGPQWAVCDQCCTKHISTLRAESGRSLHDGRRSAQRTNLPFDQIVRMAVPDPTRTLVEHASLIKRTLPNKVDPRRRSSAGRSRQQLIQQQHTGPSGRGTSLQPSVLPTLPRRSAPKEEFASKLRFAVIPSKITSPFGLMPRDRLLQPKRRLFRHARDERSDGCKLNLRNHSVSGSH